ncbi:ESX-1 secretion-associated protein [Mycobacterium sp. CBMA271]|uniref:WXG100 family type VII secretion target n=1 Tax=unclassified Mycobacteroides TaxID=2618759 RepID=UPI0012DD4F4D|nr:MULTISPECIES: type VII secretion target [unclassified Mycobacteroides]MUM18159.1 hypothetical protein [Mycobacteroides sp. CBMA 326]MUM20745.1 ESX-1 secretion-associated protein [Mycobacteroides sp. CBMA 271]
MGKTRIDIAGVQAVAGEFDNVADELQKVINQLRGLSFGASSAGQAFAAHGGQVNSGLRDVVTHLEEWYRANTAIANDLRVTAQSYADREAKNTARFDG